MLLFPESGPQKNGFTKTVTLHLCSIGPNVPPQMAYFTLGQGGSSRMGGEGMGGDGDAKEGEEGEDDGDQEEMCAQEAQG